MNAAQEYYVAASATLCAPKSIYTSNRQRLPWEIALTLPAGAPNDQLEKVQVSCCKWRGQRDKELGWRQKMPISAVRVEQKSGTVRIQSDWLFLQQLGDRGLIVLKWSGCRTRLIRSTTPLHSYTTWTRIWI